MRRPALIAFTTHVCLLAALACGDAVNNPDPEGSGGAGGSPSTTSPMTSSMTTGATGGSTTGTGGAPPSSCPPLEPAPNTSCTTPGLSCTYDNCTPPLYRNGLTLNCVLGAWVLMSEEICDAEPPACPELIVLGQTCDSSRTPGPCTWLDPCGSASSVVCSGGTWTRSLNQRGLPLPPEDEAASAAGGVSATGGAPLPVSCPASPPEIGTPCCPAFVPPICDYADPSTATGGFIPSNDGTTGGSAGSPGEDPVPPCLVCSSQMDWQRCAQ